jgi:FAD:protein FMN transferase
MASTNTNERDAPGRPISRRRVLGIAGAAAGLTAGGAGLAALLRAKGKPSLPAYRWRGVVLGASASITIAHPDPAAARRIVAESLGEVARLERIFSLYRADSALTALNRTAILADPPGDLLALLSVARRVHGASAGAFDPTVQPLWRLYAEHFARRPHDRAGPGASAIAAALKRTGFGDVAFDAERIALRPGMALTLNGIAQGYIADRVAALMRAAGISDTLIDMGEIRALGRHGSGRPWRAGIPVPGARTRMLATLDLVNTALATSGDDGTQFDAAGRFGHILDPRSGRPARLNHSVSVRAPTAALADALSTAMFVMPAEEGLAMLRGFSGVAALILRGDGALVDSGDFRTG